MRIWLLLCLCVVSGQAAAGLFADDDARKQVQQLEARIAKLETKLEKTLSSAEADKEQYIRSTLDLQMQLEGANTELRKLRGQNEELVHSLQDAEKRQKDFYIDLDTRLRHIEASNAAAATAATTTSVDSGGAGTRDISTDPIGESHAFEAAYSFYKAENYLSATAAFRDFLKNYPQSVHEANVQYWTGNSYFLMKDFKNALVSYEILVSKFADHPRAPEAMLNIAESQLNLKNNTAAKKTLKQLISQFPGSDASDKAKKRLATIK